MDGLVLLALVGFLSVVVLVAFLSMGSGLPPDRREFNAAHRALQESTSYLSPISNLTTFMAQKEKDEEADS